MNSDFKIQRYSKLNPAQRYSVRTLVNDFSSEFSTGDYVGSRGRWLSKLDRICLKNPEEGRVRETLIVTRDEQLCAASQFSYYITSPESYAEGVFVYPEYRGNGIALDLFREAFEILEGGIFYVGRNDKNKDSGPIKLTKSAQKFAELVLVEFKEAIVECKRTRSGLIRSYAVDVLKVNM